METVDDIFGPLLSLEESYVLFPPPPPPLVYVASRTFHEKTYR